MNHEDLKVSGQCNNRFEELIAKAAIVFDLKELLTCCFIPAEERITLEIALDNENGEVLARVEMPPREKTDFPRQPTRNLREVILHKFLNPTEASLELRNTLPEYAKPTENKAVNYKLTFSYGQEARTLFSSYRRCPVIICCWY